MQKQAMQNKTKLWLIFLVFAIPLIASWFLYYDYDAFHFTKTNRGTLMAKPIDVSYLYDGKSAAQEKKWRIIYVDNGVCDKDCEVMTHQLVQLQKALGKDSNRVHLTFMDAQYPQLAQLQKTFLQQAENNFSVNNKIYLVDPLGNLFMYYPGNTDAMNVLQDIKKVLEVSQIG